MGEVMPNVTLNAHFNGQQIVLDEAFDLPENAKLLVTILETSDLEQVEWQALALQNLARAYADDEPDYPLSLVKEPNPDYAGR